jgi:hypothetical protein
LDEIWNKVESKMKAINDEENRRKREALEAESKKHQIRLSIAKFLEIYSQQIADCSTFEALRTVENRINLEKANKSKYGDLYDEAKDAFVQLTDGITKQKDVVKQKIDLDNRLKEALDTKDDETAMKIQEEQELLSAEIDDNKVRIQETAINIVVNQKHDKVEQVFSGLEAKRKYWKWEVVDIKETAKKMNSWTVITTDDDKIDEFLKASKGTWGKEGKSEIIINGIKFYQDEKLV